VFLTQVAVNSRKVDLVYVAVVQWPLTMSMGNHLDNCTVPDETEDYGSN